MTEPPRIRVLLVEDHPVVRQGQRLLLELEGIDVCGEADSIETALQNAAQSHPDLVVVDLSLGDEDGLDLVGQFAAKEPRPHLLVYSMFEDPVHVDRALQAGASAYVTKRDAAGVLPRAIRECVAGRCYLSPRVEQKRAEPSDGLSLQERQVFDLLGEGHATSAIAARLDLSPRTVESYYARIQAKLGLSGMKELRQQAIAKHF
jgi:DNA-binding NarL/FixJ family response regulator